MTTPGMKPPTNRRMTDICVTEAKTTIRIDGGTIGPIIEPAAISAAEYSTRYPSLGISRMNTCPSAAASASAAPEMPEKNSVDTMAA